MARTFRKNPIVGNTGAKSEKSDKKIWHSRFRAQTRDAIAKEEELMPCVHDASDPYLFAKDGKSYISGDESFLSEGMKLKLSERLRRRVAIAKRRCRLEGQADQSLM